MKNTQIRPNGIPHKRYTGCQITKLLISFEYILSHKCDALKPHLNALCKFVNEDCKMGVVASSEEAKRG